ncbi:hypothetical protein ACGF12_13635 [Kitasatospora sp. NPDC048296]|uniref:hypothetical protein n=1 Tax=Kitasatospora sp. NPDC048296 TaxID=3364048 RepID=UPI003724962A
MSIMHQGGLSAYTDPTTTTSAVTPVLKIRTAPAASPAAQAPVDELSPDEASEVRHFDVVEFLDRAVTVGAVGTVDLGTVTPDCFESIKVSLDTEDVSFEGDIATVAAITPAGRFAVSVRVEFDGQVAA